MTTTFISQEKLSRQVAKPRGKTQIVWLKVLYSELLYDVLLLFLPQLWSTDAFTALQVAFPSCASSSNSQDCVS